MGSEEDLVLLSRAVTEFAKASGPGQAALALLKGSIELSGCSRGRLYLFDLASGTYRSFVHIRRSNVSSPVGHPEKDATSTKSSRPMLEEAIISRLPQYSDGPTTFKDELGRTGTYGSRAVFPVIRGKKTCIALLDIDAAEEGHFHSARTAIANAIDPLLNLISYVYDWKYRRILTEEIQEPIIYDQPENDFYRQVESFIQLASQMEYAVLREYSAETDTLYTLAQYGFEALTSDDRDLDLEGASTIPPFRTVIESREPRAFEDMVGPEHEVLRSREVIKDVRSFVACPVLVGSELFGVLSFGSSIEYEYNHDEIVGLQSIANGIGVSILNFRHFHEAKLEVARFQDIGTAITAMEVAQAARHEARGIIQDATESAVVASRHLRSRPPKTERSIQNLEEIGESMNQLGTVLDKIKVASRAPGRDRKVVSLQSIWNQARTQVSGRLTVASVNRINFAGPDVAVDVSPDWFRQVFINLLLNSSDAFAAGGGPRANRSIQLTVKRTESKSNQIQLRYTDNAGGINFSALKSLSGDAIVLPPEQAIFEPSITSKKDGSGWGLALVRRILKQYGGGIDLVDHRGGVAFDIHMPKVNMKEDDS